MRLLFLYCGLILLASLAGGWLPLMVRLTHTRMQIATSFVAGLMLGIAVLHLVPHAWEQFHSADLTMGWMLCGFLTMFFVQRYLHFHHHDVPEDAPEMHLRGRDHEDGHCHQDEHENEQTLADKSAGNLSWMGAVFGLTIHTLMDGIALAASVELDRHAGHAAGLLGFGTFLVIFLHKPFDALAVGTLLALDGWSKASRHWFNALFALANPAGLGLFYVGAERFSQGSPHFLGAMLAFAGGTFLSIATSDLLPELQFHAHDRGKLSLALLAGVGLSALLAQLEATNHGYDDSSAPTESHSQHVPD